MTGARITISTRSLIRPGSGSNTAVSEMTKETEFAITMILYACALLLAVAILI